MATQPRKQRRTKEGAIDESKPAAIIINQRFNGTVHFCSLTGYPTSTAYFWMIKGHIPPRHRGSGPNHNVHQHILDVAKANRIQMKPADFLEV